MSGLLPFQDETPLDSMCCKLPPGLVLNASAVWQPLRFARYSCFG